MKKFYSLFAAVILAATVNAQSFTATYDFAEAPNPDNGELVGNNLNISAFTATGLASTTTGNRFAWSGAPLAGTLDESKYFEVTLTPASNYMITINTISFRSQRSGTGPRTYVVRSSADTFAANLPASISNANPELEILTGNQFHFKNDITMGQNGNNVTPVNILDINAPVKLRFYFYDAEAVSGTFSVDDVVISGQVTSSLGTIENFSNKINLVKNTNVNNTMVFGTKANVQIVNANGQVVKTAAVSENTSLDVSSLAKGMYIVTAEVNGQKVSQKIIKN